MFKKVVVLLALIITSVTAQTDSKDYWEGCGLSPEKAKSALAQNIMVKVDVSFTAKETSSFFNDKESYSGDFQSSDKQTSTMFLNDVDTFKNDAGEFCAKVNKKKLHQFTKDKHRNLDTDYKIASLNYDDVKIKAKTIDSWLVSLKFLKGLTEVFSDLKVEKINDKVKTLQNIRKKLYLQSVTINKIGSMKGSFILMIDNKEQSFSKKIYLEAGIEHTYSVDGENICRFSDKFTLEKEKDIELSVDVDNQSYPTFTISANKSNDIIFKLDGETKGLGTQHIVHRCSGVLSYSLDYKNGLPKSDGDELTLEAGLHYDKSFSFSSFKEIEHLSGLAKNFNSGKRIEIGYGYRDVPNQEIEDNHYVDSLETIRVSVINYKDWLRHGINVEYSVADGKYLDPESYGFDVTYLWAFQLTTYGIDDNSITLFNTFAFVPYLGIEAGLGTLQMYNNKTEETIYEFDDGEDMSAYVKNYVVAKGVVGLDIVFSQQIAFGLRYSKEMTLLKSDNFAFYVNLSL